MRTPVPIPFPFPKTWGHCSFFYHVHVFRYYNRSVWAEHLHSPPPTHIHHPILSNFLPTIHHQFSLISPILSIQPLIHNLIHTIHNSPIILSISHPIHSFPIASHFSIFGFWFSIFTIPISKITIRNHNLPSF